MVAADLLLIKYNMAAQHDLGTEVAECRLCCGALSRLPPGPHPALRNRRKEEEVVEDERRWRKQRNGTEKTEEEEGREEEKTVTLLCCAADPVYTINRLLRAGRAEGKKTNKVNSVCLLSHKILHGGDSSSGATSPPLPTVPTPTTAVQPPLWEGNVVIYSRFSGH